MLRYLALSGTLLAFLAPELAAAAEPLQPISPTGNVVRLFNGRDLAGWYSWLKGTGHMDPNRVFSVKDGAIRASGDGLGYLATEKAYKDYRLVVEYKWGQKHSGTGIVRNAGILLHGIGPDGGAGGAWMTCLECQLAQGCEGDLIVIRGKDEAGKVLPATITCETQLASDGRTRWKKGGTRTVYSGKQFWWSNHEPGFQEKLDTRGKGDVASPLGQWTRVECTCRGDRVTIKVNGVVVNECFDTSPSAGKILLQTEGDEIFYRVLELYPLQDP